MTCIRQEGLYLPRHAILCHDCLAFDWLIWDKRSIGRWGLQQEMSSVHKSHEAGNARVKPTPHDDFLDGLRGLAILLVVVAHSPVIFVFLPNVGRAGVYLFFVLSAFLLS